MADEAENLTIRLLQEIRGDIAELREEVKDLTQRVDGKVRGYVRRMCGVAVSHPNCQPAASVTGMVIAMCTQKPLFPVRRLLFPRRVSSCFFGGGNGGELSHTAKFC